jgi:hypothetical protein
MNKGTTMSNAHLTTDYRLERKPDMSSQISHMNSHNFALTKSRDLDRYRTVFSSKLNIFDNSRTVPNTNYFGIRQIHDIDRRQLFSPAGMNMENSRPMTGAAFTKTWRPTFPQNL